MYIGDFPLSGTVNFKFNTRNSSSVGTTFTSGALTVYKDSGTTNTSSGLTLTANFNNITGLNHVHINLATAPSFYTTGASYQVVVLSGTVGGTSVVGEALDTFSIDGRSSVLNTLNGIENGYSLRDAMRLMLSSMAGELSGAEGNTIYIRDLNDTKNRIVATVTDSGNRTSITYDVS